MPAPLSKEPQNSPLQQVAPAPQSAARGAQVPPSGSVQMPPTQLKPEQQGNRTPAASQTAPTAWQLTGWHWSAAHAKPAQQSTSVEQVPPSAAQVSPSVHLPERQKYAAPTPVQAQSKLVLQAVSQAVVPCAQTPLMQCSCRQQSLSLAQVEPGWLHVGVPLPMGAQNDWLPNVWQKSPSQHPAVPPHAVAEVPHGWHCPVMGWQAFPMGFPLSTSITGLQWASLGHSEAALQPVAQ